MGSLLTKNKNNDFMNEYVNEIKLEGKSIYYKALPGHIEDISKDNKAHLHKQLDKMEDHIEFLLSDKPFYDFLDTEHKYILTSLLKDIQEMNRTKITKNKMEIVINKIKGIDEYMKYNRKYDDIDDCNEKTSLLRYNN